jgi:hypothetical protein
MDDCIICNSKLINIELFMKAKMEPVGGKIQPERFTYEGFCPKCEIYLTRNDKEKIKGNWTLPKIDEKKLVGVVSDEELENLKIEIENIKSNFIKKQGQRLLSVAGKNDTILKYNDSIGSKNVIKYAVKRDSYIIETFLNLDEFL